MNTQKYIDRGLVGVIVQTHVWGGEWKSRGYFRDSDEDTTRPCRCYMGHATGMPLGAPLLTQHADLAELRHGQRLADRLENAYDDATDLDDWRDHASQILTDHGYDDSCCWWEVEQ